MSVGINARTYVKPTIQLTIPRCPGFLDACCDANADAATTQEVERSFFNLDCAKPKLEACRRL